MYIINYESLRFLYGVGRKQEVTLKIVTQSARLLTKHSKKSTKKGN